MSCWALLRHLLPSFAFAARRPSLSPSCALDVSGHSVQGGCGAFQGGINYLSEAVAEKFFAAGLLSHSSMLCVLQVEATSA